MAKKIKKTTPQMKIDWQLYGGLAIRFSPIWFPVLVAATFFFMGAKPSLDKIAQHKRQINEKQNLITTVKRKKFDVEKNRKDLEEFKKKVEEFEKRLPLRTETNLITDTLEEITKEANLKFSSLKPETIKKHVLPDTNDVFVELPVNIKLRTGYYELINFLKKVEEATQLMKITNLNIKNDPGADWQHVIEFTVSAFSKGEAPDD